jgi:hypothetical protein
MHICKSKNFVFAKGFSPQKMIGSADRKNDPQNVKKSSWMFASEGASIALAMASVMEA